jgi:hypothetical protein
MTPCNHVQIECQQGDLQLPAKAAQIQWAMAACGHALHSYANRVPAQQMQLPVTNRSKTVFNGSM